MAFPEFTGNCPHNVAKDAKYTVRSGKGGSVVALIYNTDEDERWYSTTDEHPKLVNMVNAVKTQMGYAPNGSFYINEYHQVIVPVLMSDETKYFYAGKYKEKLRFNFEGKVLSGEPFDLTGNPLSEGDEWCGPHPGIPYVLTAGANDIRYEYSPRPNVIKKVRLSKKIGPAAAAQVASKVATIKGFAGGRFYVNEHGTIFAPIQESYETRYVYIGKLSLTNWFPAPEI